MWELTADNAADYLRQHGWIAPGPVHVEALTGGVSNIVLRVEQNDRRFIVKQSRPQLRTREAWFSDLNRIHREQAAMELLQPLLPAGCIPAVLFADQPQFVLGMEHAPLDAKPWKQQLLAGQVDLAIGRQVGRLLGLIHARTAQASTALEPLADRTIFVQLRVDPFYRRIQQRHADLSERIERLIDDLLTRRVALCHGDFSPKNLLVGATSITLVDHETAHLGEPAMDLGFFFSHLLLKAIKRHPDWQPLASLVRSAWAGYGEAVAGWPDRDLAQRWLPHLGVCLLARIDGTSPVEYLVDDEPRKQVARQLGRSLLLDPVSDLESVLHRLHNELTALM
jgi:5-methylthioribose kinase